MMCFHFVIIIIIYNTTAKLNNNIIDLFEGKYNIKTSNAEYIEIIVVNTRVTAAVFSLNIGHL